MFHLIVLNLISSVAWEIILRAEHILINIITSPTQWENGNFQISSDAKRSVFLLTFHLARCLSSILYSDRKIIVSTSIAYQMSSQSDPIRVSLHPCRQRFNNVRGYEQVIWWPALEKTNSSSRTDNIQWMSTQGNIACSV